MTETGEIRVLVADDHPVMRLGLKDMLEAAGGFVVVAQASDGTEAVALAREHRPDVIVMDVMMPGLDGIEACREIMDLLPDTRVMMLTASGAEDAVVEAVAAGASGYRQKYSGPEDLADAVRAVAQGGLSISDDDVRRVFSVIRGQMGLSTGLPRESLTQREKEILADFCRGMSYARIAAEREVKSVTIRNAVYHIQEKLGLSTKQELVVWAVRKGLLDQ